MNDALCPFLQQPVQVPPASRQSSPTQSRPVQSSFSKPKVFHPGPLARRCHLLFPSASLLSSAADAPLTLRRRATPTSPDCARRLQPCSLAASRAQPSRGAPIFAPEQALAPDPDSVPLAGRIPSTAQATCCVGRPPNPTSSASARILPTAPHQPADSVATPLIHPRRRDDASAVPFLLCRTSPASPQNVRLGATRSRLPASPSRSLHRPPESYLCSRIPTWPKHRANTLRASIA
ncbi:hypothetical protein BS50DRAFT_206126 [Corynespora cassiicola Philippines]|uniref:Uncharacterized protein n=1 Tax=Corynespora cassiicola Philippines TaxID=1448308 RepID=A0A2T2N5E8_CORCC|nr:hypothetical protein BS50DRAFT_206126 [Corynespora cassiicola Philippines]